MSMSNPETSSARRLDALASSGNNIAGRKLQNKSKSDRMASKPRSGRASAGRLSHLGPPTAPNKMPSASRASALVVSG